MQKILKQIVMLKWMLDIITPDRTSNEEIKSKKVNNCIVKNYIFSINHA